MGSGDSIAPPARFRSPGVVAPAPIISTRSTHQCRSDVNVAVKSPPSAAIPKVLEEEEEEEEEDVEGDDEKGNSGDEEGRNEKGGDIEDIEDEEGGQNEEDREDESGELDEEDKAGEKSVHEPDNFSHSALTDSHDSSVVVTHQRGRSTTPKAATAVLDGDVRMQSPQNSSASLRGASRTVGGLFRGNAVGNSLNAADFSNHDNNNYIGPVHGQVNIYLAQDDPSRLSPDSLTPYARFLHDYAPQTPIAPVLQKVARKYSPVRSNYFLIIFLKF